MWYGLPKATVLIIALAGAFVLAILALKTLGFGTFLRAHAAQIVFYFVASAGLIVLWDEARFGP